jgi:hypothetical protein
LTSCQDIVNRVRFLTTNGRLGWFARLDNPPLRTEKGGGLVSAKIQAALIVLGMVVLAALNGSSPWGP